METLVEEKGGRFLAFARKNWLILLILVFTFSLNLYYFNLTKTQALWWDEAVYMINAKHLAFGFPETLFGSPGRSILEVFLWVPLLKLGFSEIFFKFLHILFMVSSVWMVYYLGSKFFNNFVGLFAAFATSIFWVYVFVTSRLMPDNFGLFVFLLAMVFFYKGYLAEVPNPKFLWISGALFILAVYAREITALFGPILLLSILIKEKLEIFKNKKVWGFFIATLLMLAPFLLFYQVKFGDPITFYTSRIGEMPSQEDAAAEGPGGVPWGSSVWIKMFSLDAMRPGLLVLFLIGLAFFLKLILGFDLLFKKTDNLAEKRDIFIKLFLFMWIFIPLLFFTFWYRVYDERYISTSYPAIFFICGFGLKKIYEKVKKHSKAIGVILVLFFIFLITLAPFNTSSGKMGHFYRVDDLIKSRVGSYAHVRDAGIWLNQNSAPGDLIFGESSPQLTYYANRKVEHISQTPEELLAKINDLKPAYWVVSVFETHPQYAYSWPNENQNLVTPVQAYFFSENQPSLIIYKFNYPESNISN